MPKSVNPASIDPAALDAPRSSDILLDVDELDLALSNPLVRALLHHVSDGAVVIEAGTRRVVQMNRRARELLGYGPDEALDCLCREALNAPDCSLACPLTALLEGGRGGAGGHAVTYRGRSGARLVQADTRMLVLRARDGRALAGIELFRDLTETVALTAALHERRSLHEIIGRSAPMQGLYELVEQVAPHDVPVLIIGESGVGKERFADALQYLSDRMGKPYIKVNCGALSPSLIESELFGHKKGAFTGASQDRRGCFEEADTGTLLLDEVGELPLQLQVKLLRVLQQGEIQRVGEDRPRRVDVRILAATNRDIDDDVAAGHFREDLYYRLAGVRVPVPPLRDRPDDIPLLAEHFLARFAAESARRGREKQTAGLSAEAVAALVDREWRGNVRELENVLRLAWIRVPAGQALRPEHLGLPQVATREPVHPSLAKLEEAAIRKAMDKSDGNVAGAARILGIDRTTLWRKLKKAGGY